MTAFLTWRDDLLMGIDVLDTDHQQMVRLLNVLVAAGAPIDPPAPGHDPEPTAPTPATSALQHLDELVAHIRDHFEREEAFLRAIAYPDYVNHKRAHTMQMAEFVDLRRRLADGGTRYLEPEAVQGLKDWFFDHVIAEDRKYAAYFFEQHGGRIPEEASDQSI